MGDGQRVGDEADGSGDGSDLDVTAHAGDAESHVERAGACVKDQRDVQEIAFVEQGTAGLGGAQKGGDQQEGDAESNQD